MVKCLPSAARSRQFAAFLRNCRFSPQFLVYFTFVFTRTDATLEKQKQKANFVHSFRKTTTFVTLSKRTRIAKQILLTKVRRNVYPELGCHISAEVGCFQASPVDGAQRQAIIHDPSWTVFIPGWVDLATISLFIYIRHFAKVCILGTVILVIEIRRKLWRKKPTKKCFWRNVQNLDNCCFYYDVVNKEI